MPRSKSRLLELEAERGEKLSARDLADIAWRIDSPELHAIAVRLHEGLEEMGRSFHDLSADELKDLAAEAGSAHPA